MCPPQPRTEDALNFVIALSIVIRGLDPRIS